ncbi:MAG TPA: bifunctional diguanylate cyclase/phosphodiesterase [Bacillales bacterium]
MQTYTYQYQDPLSLQNFIEKNRLSEPRHVLVQMNMGNRNRHLSKSLINQLKEQIPHARIFQWSEEKSETVEDGKRRKILLSFTAFEETTVDELTLEMMKLNRHLQESEQRYRSLFEHHPNLIYSMDRDGMITSVNPALIKETGYMPKEIRNTPAVDFVVEGQRASTIEYFRKTLEGEPQHFSLAIKNKENGSQLYNVTNIPIFVDGSIVGVHGIAQNITEQKQDQEKIARLAYHDVLTGLPNRLLFQQTLESVIKRARRHGQEMAVMFIDLDRFKIINDSVGHHNGDEIMKKAVARMEDAIQNDHFLSRFNGDEFVLLVPRTSGTGEIREIARNLLKAFKKPVEHNNRDFFLSASIGISMFPNDAGSGEDLMKKADTALNRAKQRGKGKIQFYKEEMKSYFEDRLELESDLRKALEHNEFSVYYQPQINMKDGKVCGSEALIRWEHPRLGLVSPEVFIPLAEETGLINEIGNWVMRTACKQAKGWQDDGYDEFFVSVNVSALQFQKAGFLNEVRNILAESGLEPQYLHLELTESITIQDIRHSIQHVRALKKLGVKVSIDDFGTGYSSLSYLKDFAIDILKIDRSFVRNLKDGSHDGAIVKAILTMCNGLSVKTVAEGVETEEQLNMLRTFGCGCVQGFFYSRPLPVKKFERFINIKNAQMQ